MSQRGQAWGWALWGRLPGCLPDRGRSERLRAPYLLPHLEKGHPPAKDMHSLQIGRIKCKSLVSSLFSRTTNCGNRE